MPVAGWLLCNYLSSRESHRCDGTRTGVLKVSGDWARIVNAARHLSLTPTMDAPRARYSGTSRKLVVALDIGTTFSGAAYAFLDPGQFPQIRSVTRPVLPPILDPVTKTTNKMQVPQRSESWVRKDSLYIIL